MEIYLTILGRVLVAALCGFLIGFERDMHGRAAGLRTHSLVAAGAAIFTIVSILLTSPTLDLSLVTTRPGDISRVAAQIVSGIGFLGAGTIVKTGFTVKGLTTAACLWFVAALGMTCGIGMGHVGLTIAILTMIAIFFGKIWEKKLHRLFPFQLIVESTDYISITDLQNFINQTKGYEITTLNISIINQDSEQPLYKAIFFIDSTTSNHQPKTCLEFTSTIRKNFPKIQTITYKCEG